jgi:hypothetical protein
MGIQRIFSKMRGEGESLSPSFLRRYSYTTFSSYTFESLIMENQWLPGLFNLLGSAVLGGVAVFFGIIVARAI